MTIICTTLDPNNPVKLTEEEKAAYDAMEDEDIDYSDAPEMTDEMFANSWRGNFVLPPVE